MGPDQAVLVDKLIQTRKDIAKKDEKVEFLEEHIRQLTEELQKKTKQVFVHIKHQEWFYFIYSLTQGYQELLVKRRIRCIKHTTDG